MKVGKNGVLYKTINGENTEIYGVDLLYASFIFSPRRDF